MLSSQDWQPGWRKPDDWFSFQHVYVVTAITDIDITIIDPYNMQLGQRTRPLGVWFDTYMARITIGN